MEITPKIFICYDRNDEEGAILIYQKLSEQGFEPWMDKDILPGQNKDVEIIKAIKQSDFFLVCISKNLTNKSSVLNKEFKYAIDMLDNMPQEAIYLLPVRLEETDIPVPLNSYNSVDIFREGGFERLVGGIKAGLSERTERANRLHQLYNFDNIRKALNEEFSIEQLKEFCFESPSFRPLFKSLPIEASKQDIINMILARANQQEKVEAILNRFRYLSDEFPEGDDPMEKYQPFCNLPYADNLEGQNYEIHFEELYNPFIVGNPISPENNKVFMGRYDIVSSIVDEIKNNTQRNSILLYGRKRMGKTSVLLNINNLIKQPNLITVYISCQGGKFHSDVNFCYYLVKEIYKSFNESLFDTSFINEKQFLEKDQFNEDPVLTLSEFFDCCQEFMEKNQLYILITIDEYEEIDSHIKMKSNQKGISRDLLLELRDTLQHRSHFAFLFSGTHFMRELSTINWSEIFINLKTLHVSFLHRDDSYNLLTRPVPRLEYKNDDLIQKIIELAGCQPYLLQAIASELVEILNSKRKFIASEIELREAIKRTLKKCSLYFEYIWNTECLNDNYRELLRVVSEYEEGVLKQKLYNYKHEIQNLIRREILKERDDFVKFTMPLIGLWIKEYDNII